MDSQHPILLQLTTEFDQKLGHLTKEYHDAISVYAHARNMSLKRRWILQVCPPLVSEFLISNPRYRHRATRYQTCAKTMWMEHLSQRLFNTVSQPFGCVVLSQVGNTSTNAIS